MKKKQSENSRSKPSREGYNPGAIEKKWQEIWEKSGIYEPDLEHAAKPFYNLMMFPYPSAEGMHVGNMYAFTGSDIYGRFKRMQGFDVFEPIGLDGFGIHSENYALKVGRHPRQQAKISEKNFYRQLRATGNAYDWSRKLETYDPNYYKWTQWIFIQLFKNNLAYQSVASVNFCPSCKTVLADEQVLEDRCERCGTVVKKRKLMQWFFRITKYADRLLKNLENLDWSDKVKIAQRNWIGKSEGARVRFEVKNLEGQFIEVFTTRPDTLFGATFIVLAPEHEFVLKYPFISDSSVNKYVSTTVYKTDEERFKQREKTGVQTNYFAINPVNGEEIPIWVADYVLMGYGTGAIMAVPGHDQRDFEFAKKFHLPIKQVIASNSKESNLEKAYIGEGKIINSSEWNGWNIPEQIGEVVSWLEKKAIGKKEISYHLRDWLISRQRYWGPPIPMVYCEKCDWQPVDEKELPVLLPDVRDWKPLGTGKSPLADHPEFYKTKCLKCGGEAKRETDVSDTFLDSSWYFLRYLSTEITDSAWDKKRSEKWLPVYMYIGGAEHSVLHLLYTRFLSMVFYDLGLVHFEEPFSKFRAHGLLISRGAKMSKSRGNVVVPDAYIEKYGADTLRCYLMFCGRFTQGGDFRDTGISGMHKFLKRVWKLASEKSKVKSQKSKVGGEVVHMMHKTIKKVTEDIESLDYNTAIAALMEWLNALEGRQQETRNNKQETSEKVSSFQFPVSSLEYETFLKLLAPFAPHMTEELYQQLFGNSKFEIRNLKFRSIHSKPWPKYDPELARAKTITLVVQVNGQLRDRLLVEAGVSREEAEKLALESPRVQKYLGKKPPQKVIFVPDRLINFVV